MWFPICRTKHLRTLIVVGIITLLTVAACNGDDNANNDNGSDEGQPRLYDWDRSADAILIRIDEVPLSEREAYRINTIPLCSIWGNGRIIWSNNVIDTNEILEGRLSDETIRGFIEDLIGYGFYSWEEDIIPPVDEDLTLQSITVNLYSDPRTVERYGNWPGQSFDEIVTLCHNLAEERAQFVPLSGGWVSAYPIEFDTAYKSQEWPRNAPFTMAELAASETPFWVEGAWAAELWQYTREVSIMQVTERGEAYEVAMQVPGISRSSPPPPPDSGQSDNQED
ncbi:MAG: hypothetical protein GYB66_08750 [Chloroflexi bacterium]|nr:hypothetical protein [Chloroflexota bacterium]